MKTAADERRVAKTQHTDNQVLAFGFLKGRLSDGKRWPFTTRKTAFWKTAGHEAEFSLPMMFYHTDKNH